MIVCATPRSGGTIFAQDIARLHNATFINELMPLYIEPFNLAGNNWKNTIHELGNQPMFTMDSFFDNLHKIYSKDIVVLVNGTNSHWIYEKADYFVARKNQKQWLLSFANLLIQMDTPFDILCIYIKTHVYQAVCMFNYCKKFNKEIDFYEESVYYREGRYKSFSSYKHRDKVRHFINEMIHKSQIVNAYPGLHF